MPKTVRDMLAKAREIVMLAFSDSTGSGVKDAVMGAEHVLSAVIEEMGDNGASVREMIARIKQMDVREDDAAIDDVVAHLPPRPSRE